MKAITISPRQQQLLEALRFGKTNDQLAAEFGLSPNTVKVHLWRLYRKLGVHSRTQALHWYQHSGQAATQANTAVVDALLAARDRITLDRDSLLETCAGPSGEMDAYEAQAVSEYEQIIHQINAAIGAATGACA